MSARKLGRVGDVIEEASYGTSTKANDRGEGVPVIRMGNVTFDGTLDLSKIKHVELEAAERERHRLWAGDILFNRTNSKDLVGKTGVWDGRCEAVAASYFVRLRLKKSAMLPAYFCYCMNAPQMKERLFATARGAIGQANINTKELSELPIPLPPLEEQRRIVDILDRANGIRRLRREALDKTRQLTPALFLDMFGDPRRSGDRYDRRPLHEVADIRSGITKGRKLQGRRLVEVPYIRVANVQDGFLTLNAIKTIAIRPEEIALFALEEGDLLMTEGGDPDKLGGAALWHGEVQACVHQNHVFRVRPRRGIVDPHYLRALAGSAYGKQYFLQVAKRTTGIASINKTQLGNLPVVLPPRSEQEDFASRVAEAQGITAEQERMAEAIDQLVASLMSQLFDRPPSSARAAA